VRGRVVNNLKSTFKTLEEAEKHFNLTLSDYLNELSLINTPACRQQKNCADKCVQSDSQDNASNELPDIANLPIPLTTKSAIYHLSSLITANSLINVVIFLFDLLSNDDQLELTNNTFLMLANSFGIDSNPGDFVQLALNSMINLQSNNKSNLIYKCAYCIGTKRPGSSDTLFPLSRMPFGLVQFQIEFFSCTNITQVCFAFILTIMWALK
jgi:hypothetical protein